MQHFAPGDDQRRYALIGFGLCVVVALVVTAGAVLATPADETPDPVAYDDVVELGLSAETDALMADEATIPRAQVFYSQFQYVVGYNGIESLVVALADDRTETQFGYPIAAYVRTYDRTGPTTTDDGLFRTERERLPGWTPADEATYVVGSDARTPAGETAIPFADPEAADAFADEHDGEVADWTTLRDRSFDVDTASTVRSMAPERWDRADERVADAERRAERPVSVVVGEDEPTIADAVATAPENTTVVVPPGTYEERFEVNRSVTIAGEDAAIRGDGTGSVITVRAPDVAITGLDVSGSGNLTRDEDAVQGPPDDADGSDAEADDADGADVDATWDTNVQLGYGHGDAGIRAIDAPGLVIDDVAVETDASGVLLRGGSHATIRDLTVEGTDDWRDGFMGVIGMESRVVVTDSTFTDGRDGIYLHRADGSVIRNSSFADNRYGVHLMYTGGALIADNVVRNGEFGGITVMTRPEGNAIVGNDVRGSSAGVQASGTRTYVGYNTLADNGLGLSTSSRQSLYEHNVIAGNEEGARATTVVPSSRIVANDFVDNDRHAGAGAGPLRIWADGVGSDGDGVGSDRHVGGPDDVVGNYWEGANARFSDAGERGYRPTSRVDGAFHREPAAVTLAESPAVTLLDRLAGTTPGARSGSVLDPAPATEPYHPDRVATATNGTEPAHPDWRVRIDAATATDRGVTGT